MHKKSSLSFPLLCVSLAFWACGDDSGTSSKDTSSEAGLFADSYDDLPVCSDKREGTVAYVKDEKPGTFVKMENGL